MKCKQQVLVATPQSKHKVKNRTTLDVVFLGGLVIGKLLTSINQPAKLIWRAQKMQQGRNIYDLIRKIEVLGLYQVLATVQRKQ